VFFKQNILEKKDETAIFILRKLANKTGRLNCRLTFSEFYKYKLLQVSQFYGHIVNVESTLDRLFHTFLSRDASISEWQLGCKALANHVNPGIIIDWLQNNSSRIWGEEVTRRCRSVGSVLDCLVSS
jgi:hypothetical protein